MLYNSNTVVKWRQEGGEKQKNTRGLAADGGGGGGG